MAPKPVEVAATVWSVRLGALDGTAPTAASESALFDKPVVHYRTGSQLDYCVLPYLPNSTSQQLVNLQLLLGLSRQVEIAQVSKKAGVADTLVFWGEINTQKLSVNGGTESASLIASIEPYHFGSVLSRTMYRKTSGDPLYVYDPIVFNPLIDDLVEGNRSEYEYTPSAGKNRYFWVHPNSVRTGAARTNAQDGDSSNMWTLATAIRTLCWQCNPDETYIKNPTESDFDGWFSGAPTVENLQLPIGKYLPQYLDMILPKYGYGWAMTYAYVSGTRQVSYRIYKLNTGVELTIRQQRPDSEEPISTRLTNVSAWDMRTSVTGQVNRVQCFGAYKEFEVTIELYRGWLESQDALTAASLTQSTGASYATNTRAWRNWVANEAGDSCSTRVTVAPIPSTPLDLDSVFGADKYVKKRRRALACLTRFKDDTDWEGRRQRDILVEYYVDSAWKIIPDGWGETALDDQIGIRFAGDSPPAELVAMGNDARIRITCTIQSDERLTADAARATSSVNLREANLVTLIDDRFKYKQRISSGTFTSSLIAETQSESVDNSTALAAFAESMRVIEDVAVTRGRVDMLGINLQAKIGMVIPMIKGRDVTLNRMAESSSIKKYAQITDVTHNLAGQSTILTIAPILEAGA